jgi:AraC family transcriptional regulator
MATRLGPGEFFGKERHRRAFGGFSFTETVYGDGMIIPKHEHAEGYLSFVVAGFHRQHIDRRTREVSPRTLTVHPPGEVHANHWHGGGHCLNVAITSARLEQIRQYARCLDQPAEFHGGMPARLAARLCDEFWWSESASPLNLEGLTLEILAEISREPRPGLERCVPRWLRRARELLHERFSENLSLGDVAGTVGVHPAHLGREFRRHFGCTPGDYVREVRIEFARLRLSQTDEPLVAIALAAGFADQSHFTNAFRGATGLTPAQYRKRQWRRSSSANRRSLHPRTDLTTELS